MKLQLNTSGAKVKIAFDEHISNKSIEDYRAKGNDIVYVAPHGTPDELWLEEAVLIHGAEVIISRDYDIPNLLDKNNWSFVQWRNK